MADAIVPIEQRTIDFYGDELVAIRDGEGAIWIPVRRLADALGIAYQGQIARVQRDPVLSEVARSVNVVLTDGRTFEMVCLPLKYVRGWLFSIDASRTKPHLRDKLIAYQREVIEVIDRHFSKTINADDVTEALAAQMEESLRQQAELWKTIREEIRRRRMNEQWMQELDERVGDHDTMIAELQRITARQSELLTRHDEAIRLLPAPATTITPEQKAAIKALVDDIVAAAQAKGTRLGQGRNDYPAVWDAFKRRFDLAKYDELPGEKFDEAAAWLKEWRGRIG